jgi:hypothetical protein
MDNGEPPPFRWASEDYEDAAHGIGLALLPLLLSPRYWVHRRVETIGVLSDEQVRRSVSVDFTVPHLVRDLLRLPPEPYETSDQALFAVPIAIIGKGKLRNFDLRRDGKALPMFSREQNSLAAAAVLTWVVQTALDDAGIEDEMEDWLPELFHEVVHGDPDESLDRLDEIVTKAEAGNRQAEVISDSDDAAFLLTRLATGYLLIAMVDDISNRAIVKFAYDEHHGLIQPSGISERFKEAVGTDALLMEIATPSATFTNSYHCDVVVPEELRVEFAFLFDGMGTDGSGGLVDSEFDVDRASLYTSGLPLQANPNVFLAIRSERQGFPGIAAFVAVVSTLVLAAGASVGRLDPTFASAPIAVIFSLSAIYAGWIVRSGEHRLVRAQFFWPRLMLIGVAVCSLVASASLAFGARDCVARVIWISCASIAGVLAAGLWIFAKNAMGVANRQSSV